jgi:hypothetical protein
MAAVLALILVERHEIPLILGRDKYIEAAGWAPPAGAPGVEYR